MLPEILFDVELWKRLSIPFVAALVGWGTNWVAIQMTFRPLEFVGIRPFLGWQGIIPSKAGRMAEIFVDKTMFRLGTLPELFQHLDPRGIARHIAVMMDRRLEAYTDEVMFYSRNAVWRRLPPTVKAVVYRRVRAEMPQLVSGLMDEIAANVEDLVDFKHMLVERLTSDRDLLNRLFLESGAAEFRFIVRSGLYFGFLFGLLQLAVWWVLEAWWVLPVFGVIVGYATNWLALRVIFQPLHPRRIGRWTVQGLFLKRQNEVAAVWCRLVASEILTLQYVVYAMLHGPRADRTREIIRARIEPIVDEVVEGYRAVAELTIGDGALETIKRQVGDKAVEVSTDPFDHWPFVRDRAEIIENLLRERMQALPPEDFQNLLRPCFQEDEMKLILAGAALGFLAGLLQLIFVFGGF